MLHLTGAAWHVQALAEEEADNGGGGEQAPVEEVVDNAGAEQEEQPLPQLPLNDVDSDSDASNLGDEDFLLVNLDDANLDADLVRDDGEGKQAKDDDDD